MANEELANRDGTEVLDYEDRARLAFTEVVMLQESNDLTPINHGKAILHFVTDEQEVAPMDDAVVQTLAMVKFYGGSDGSGE